MVCFLAPIEVEILAIFLGEIATKSGKMVCKNAQAIRSRFFR